jgi:hypothetical protein
MKINKAEMLLKTKRLPAEFITISGCGFFIEYKHKDGK